MIRTVIIGGEPNVFLASWLKSRGLAWRIGADAESGEIARNREVAAFLSAAGGESDRLVLIDRDISPRPPTAPSGAPADCLDALFASADALVYGAHPARDLRGGHFGDGNLATGCMNVSRAVLAAVGPQWFKTALTADGTSIARCSCRRFADLAAAAGFRSRMIGSVYHIARILATVDAAGKVHIAPWPL